jgi:UDPglucose 6-dehydrogenase
VRITVFGAGYVGLVSAACLADFGHEVACVDVDTARIDALRSGVTPIFEPGLDELLGSGTAAGRLTFTTDPTDVVPGSDIVVVAVGTPASDEGEVDLSQVRSAIDTVAHHAHDGVVVVIKSTVPVGTTRQVGAWLRDARPGLVTHAAANPEFLRQGTAVEDFLRPDRLVLGPADDLAEKVLRELYRPLIDGGVATLTTDPETAELIKYASNAFLAIKVSFINEVADLCEASGASVEEVAIGMGLDPRIGPRFLAAGPGFGGSCLPKDTQGLLLTSNHYGTRSRIVAAALEVNRSRIGHMVDKVANALDRTLDGARIAVLGLTFKADTDDLRYSPAVDIVEALVAAGAIVVAHDPRGMEAARILLPATVGYADGPYEAMANADAAVIATEWAEFADLDLSRVRDALASPVLVDLRNLYEPAIVEAAGLHYSSVGR